MECTLHPKCTCSGLLMCVVFLLSPRSGILVFTCDLRSVVGVYTPLGVVMEWYWSVHSRLECTIRQGKGNINKNYLFPIQ